MKLTRIVFVAGLIVLRATEALGSFSNVNSESLEYQNLTLSARGDPDDDTDDDDYSSPAFYPADDELWHQSKCRGVKLMLATTQNPAEAERFISPLASVWDGDMTDELATWGYKERTDSPDNDFSLDAIKPMLDDMRISTQISLYGGPNYCYSLTHCNSDIVERDSWGHLPPIPNQHYTANGRKYRVTGAYASIVVNPDVGYILFLRRGSAEHEARSLWNIRDQDSVPRDELPALRASSDIAWAFWKRTTDTLGKINFFVSMSITNGDTEKVIDRVLEGKTMTVVPVWPGIFVGVTSEDYLALMGTPNARGVGYFLAQHKAQIGGNRYVKGIRIFRARADSALSSMVFFVDWAPFPPPAVPTDPIDVLVPPPGSGMEALMDTYEGNVTKRSEDGKNIVRSHKIWTRL
ncbi:hypothetical protein G6011_03494 [Alternaria panax]|uniref:Uncharacterized protein n=1 Tax=Alternaria panax TaxID=48097 RepID=A0AAD4IF83_9PLEO|nr:hypothetical protein G6011_03494 [Alternaria panax]